MSKIVSYEKLKKSTYTINPIFYFYNFSYKQKRFCPYIFRIINQVNTVIWLNNRINIFDNAAKAVFKADVIFSDKVISLNDKVNKKKKLNDFKNFGITKKLMEKAKSDCIFLHCLPRGSEVEEEVFFSKQSKVWQQALNRVHVQKSILLYCFGKLR